MAKQAKDLPDRQSINGLPLVGHVLCRFRCGHTTEEFVELTDATTHHFGEALAAYKACVGEIGILETDCPDCHKAKKEKSCPESERQDLSANASPSEPASPLPTSS